MIMNHIPTRDNVTVIDPIHLIVLANALEMKRGK